MRSTQCPRLSRQVSRYARIYTHLDDAACENVWNEVHGDLMGPWPDGCPDPEEFRREEREALIPAIGVFKDRGVLVSPERDATVAAKALREVRDEMSRWEGWDSRDIGHAFLSESVLDALDEAVDRIEREADR